MSVSSITQSVADTGGFIPQEWAEKALDVLRNNIVLAKVCAKDSDYEAGWKGKQLNIPYPGTFTAQDKTATNPVTVQAPSGGATVAVTLSKHKTVDFLVEDFAQAQANSDLMMRYVQPAAIALAEQLETDLLAQYANLTGTAVGTAGTDLTAAVIRSARKNLNIAKAPVSDRFMVISPKDEVALMGDSNLQNFFAFARPEVVEKGALANLYGFDLYMSQLTPVVAGTPNDTQNIAAHKDAILLATRPFTPPPANSGVSASIMTDSVSGLTIRVLYQYSIDYRGVRVSMDMLYGTTVLRPSLGLIAHA